MRKASRSTPVLSALRKRAPLPETSSPRQVRNLRAPSWSTPPEATLILTLLLACGAPGVATRPPLPAADPPDIGRELFLRTWVVDDPRVDGGDGLGPVANARSCAACHNQGGAGGAGPPSRNAPVLGSATNHRAPPPLFGLGLLDHVSEADIRLGERPAIPGVAGISGRSASRRAPATT